MEHTIIRANSTGLRRVCKNFVNDHHSYIDWADRPSRKMYWLLKEDDQFVGVFGLGSAFAKPKAIMNFMEKYSIEFNELANNIVYCLNGQEDKNAGTKFLKLLRNDALIWWKENYGDDIKAFQTFILPPRVGTIYKADNWTELGNTTGGKTLTTRTIKPQDLKEGDKVETRTFKSGEVKHLLREFSTTDSKMMLVRLVSSKERRYAMKSTNTVNNEWFNV